MWQSFPLNFHSKKTTGFAKSVCHNTPRKILGQISFILHHPSAVKSLSKCLRTLLAIASEWARHCELEGIWSTSTFNSPLRVLLARHCELGCFFLDFPICSMFWYIPAQKDKVWYLKRKIGNNQLFLGFSFNYLQNK